MNELENVFFIKTGIKFNDFYKTYKGWLKFHINKYYLEPDILDDIISFAFTQSLININSFDPNIAQIQTWLYTIAENEARWQYKKCIKFKSISLDEKLDNNIYSLKETIPYIEDDNDLYYENIEKVNKIKDIIINMKDCKYKNSLLLRDVEGYDYESISIELGINLNTIKSQIRKGRKEVKRLYNIKK